MSRKRLQWTLETVRQRCEEEGECWMWQHGTNSGGYPYASMNSKTVSVRAWVYETFKRPCPPNMLITTSCGNRRCCNPEHLVAVTYSRMVSKSFDRRNPVQFARNKTRAKLDWQQVRQIRAIPQPVNRKAVASQYGISLRTLSDILRGKSWHEGALKCASVFTWGQG